MNGEELGRYEHFRLIRENPAYRTFIMLEETRAEMQPPLSPPEPQPEILVAATKLGAAALNVSEIHHIPVELGAHMTRIRNMEEKYQRFENYTIRKFNELSQRKTKVSKY